MELDNKSLNDTMMSREDLAHLGGGHIAYVRELSGMEAAALFPALKAKIEDGAQVQRFFALFEANGNPIVLSDSVDIVQEKAEDAKLSMMTVH